MTTSEALAHSVALSLESFTNLLADIPEEMANRKPEQEKWSVLECVEHIYLVEKSVVKLLTRPASEEHLTEETAEEKFGAGKLRHILSNRDRQYPAPEFYIPKNTFSTLADAKMAVTALRADLIKALEERKIKFTGHTFPHPVMGDFTKLDWVNFLLEHAARHYKQIEEIKLCVLNSSRQ